MSEAFILSHCMFMHGAFLSRRDRLFTAKLCRGEECLHAEVISLREWLELVVVTSRTAEGKAEKDRARGVSHVVEGVEPALGLIGGVHHVWAKQIKAGRNQSGWLIREEFVSCELLANETVIRLVFVECADDIIAVTP